MKRLSDNNGHSLVELIVSFAVIAILLTALFMICSATYKTIEVNRHDTHADIVIDNISDYIKNTTGKTVDDLLVYDLSVPGDIMFAPGSNGEACYALAFIGGRLYDLGDVSSETSWLTLHSLGTLGSYRAFNEEYYNNTRVLVGIERSPHTGKWAAITLCAHRDGNRITRNRTVNFSMLNEGAEISIENGADPNQAGLTKDGDIKDGIGNIKVTDILFVYYRIPIV